MQAETQTTLILTPTCAWHFSLITAARPEPCSELIDVTYLGKPYVLPVLGVML